MKKLLLALLFAVSLANPAIAEFVTNSPQSGGGGGGGGVTSLSSPQTTITFSSATGAITADVAPKFNVNYLGTCSYPQYNAVNNITPGADQTTALQNWLDDCYLKAIFTLSAGSEALDDQNQRNCIIAELPRGNYSITSPLVIPENVCTHFQGTIIRSAQAGSATNFYTGDTTSLALANKQQPAVILVPHAHILDNLDIYGNSNGSDGGSGFSTKSWYAAPGTVPTIQAGGTGYANGDLICLGQPSKAPYFPICVTVTSNSGGAVTGVSYSGGSVGSYALPPVLQQKVWTVANGFTGAVPNGNVGQIFDVSNPTWFLSYTNGAGTGAEFTVTWNPDFAGSGAMYNPGLGLIADTLIDNISANSLGTATDATYGPTFGVMLGGLNYDIPGQIETVKGYHGVILNGVADVHGGTFNPVDAAHSGMKIVSGGSMSFKMICDTPVVDCVEADNVGRLNIEDGSYAINFANPPAALTGSAVVVIGGDTTVSGASAKLSGADIHMNMQNMGVPGFFLDYIADQSHIEGQVSNILPTTSAVAFPTNTFAQFGTHNATNFTLTGSIDGVAAGTASLSGTVPLTGIHVWDGTLQGWINSGGVCNIVGSGAPTNGATGTGYNKCSKGSFYTDSTNGTFYQNTNTSASPTYTQFATGGSGSGTVQSGTTNQVAYYSAAGTVVSGESLSALIDAVFGNAQGDIIYRSNAGWTALAPGTSGQFLETLGASANPLWSTVASSGTVNLGTLASTNPRISGDGSSGLFTSAANTVDIAAGGKDVMEFASTSQGVNYFVVNPGISGGEPTITCTGTDSNPSCEFLAKGSGGWYFGTPLSVFSNIQVQQLRVTGSSANGNGMYLPTTNTPAVTSNSLDEMWFKPVASSVDYFVVQPAATANPATITILASGTDSNVGIALTPKGTAPNTLNGAVAMPTLASSSAATTGTVCWTTSTGNLTVDTAAACLASLEELKDKHGDIQDALGIISKIKPFWFTWKENTPEYAGDKHEQPGMGAHQVESVDKRLAAYTPDGKLKGVRYLEMAAVLIKAIQEQQQEIDDLRRQLKTMSPSASGFKPVNTMVKH